MHCAGPRTWPNRTGLSSVSMVGTVAGANCTCGYLTGLVRISMTQADSRPCWTWQKENGPMTNRDEQGNFYSTATKAHPLPLVKDREGNIIVRGTKLASMHTPYMCGAEVIDVTHEGVVFVF